MCWVFFGARISPVWRAPGVILVGLKKLPRIYCKLFLLFLESWIQFSWRGSFLLVSYCSQGLLTSLDWTRSQHLKQLAQQHSTLMPSETHQTPRHIRSKGPQLLQPLPSIWAQTPSSFLFSSSSSWTARLFRSPLFLFRIFSWQFSFRLFTSQWFQFFLLSLLPASLSLLPPPWLSSWWDELLRSTL